MRVCGERERERERERAWPDPIARCCSGMKNLRNVYRFLLFIFNFGKFEEWV